MTGRGKLLKTTGGVTTVMSILTKTRSGTAPLVMGVKPPCNRKKVDWRPYGDPVAVLLR